jgi:hypothetical protein
MSQAATDGLVSFLGTQPDYLMEFTADFGGDTADYLALAEGGDVDVQALTAAQVGDALRQFMEIVPAPGLPSDLDLDDVDWEEIGARMDEIVASPFLGM